MGRVTMYRSSDGELFSTVEECNAHEARIKMVPALEAIAGRAPACDDMGLDNALLDTSDIATFIADNADDIRAILNDCVPAKRRGRKATKGETQ